MIGFTPQQEASGASSMAVTEFSFFDLAKQAIEAREARAQKWDNRFIELAKFIASWSLDPSTKTGAVVVDEQRSIVSVGYNGFARGVKDLAERYNDRDLKYKMIVHCERNAMLFAKRDLSGCTLYTWPFMSCAPCAAMVIQAGIKRVVAPKNDNPRWQEDFKLSQTMFQEAGVEVELT